jgi:hypothetical protein
MKPKILLNNTGHIKAVLIALILTLFWTIPVQAESLSENFSIKFEPVIYDRSQAVPGEVFQATFKGHAECYKNLPVPVSEATITMQIVAKNIAGGYEFTLNPKLTISVKPFPDKQGETFDMNTLIPLQFPAGTEPGEYHVTGKFIEAKGKVILIWTDFSGYLPSEQDMGTMKCALPGTNPTPAPVTPTGNTAIPTPPTTSVTSKTTPAITDPTPPRTTPESPLLPPTPAKENGQKSTFSWWIIPVIVIAVVALLFIFIFGFRRRE